MYDIKLRYSTGNSFITSITEDTLDIPMPTLAIAKANLKRIKEHWAIYQNRNEMHVRFADRMVDEQLPDWFIADKQTACGIQLLVNEEGDVRTILFPFWTGYFEHLHEGEIIALHDDETHFST